MSNDLLVLCSRHTTTATLCVERAFDVLLTADSLPPEWVMLLPAGINLEALDGRKFRNSKPEVIVAAFDDDPRDLPIDWEHASEIKAPKGEEAPAAGWIDRLEVRDGAIWGHVKWTARGLESLKSRSYRYISPAFLSNKKTGIITKLVSAGLTNGPAFDLEVVAARADLAAEWTGEFINDLPDSAFLLVESGGEKDEYGKTVPRSLRHFPYRDEDGKIDLPHLRNAIARIPQSEIQGFDAEAKERLQTKARQLLTEPEKAQMEDVEDMKDMMDPKMLEMLGLKGDVTVTQVIAAIEAHKKQMDDLMSKLKTSEEELAQARAKLPELEKFVPRADYDAALARVKAVEDAQMTDRKSRHDAAVAAEVDSALKAGKITPATKDFYLSTCSSVEGLEQFRKFVSTAPVVAPDQVISGGKLLASSSGAGEPTEEQLAIARRCGISKEAFAAAKV